MGTCLLGRYVETGFVYPPILRSLHSNGCTHHDILATESVVKDITQISYNWMICWITHDQQKYLPNW
jgi:hypothetical protein